MANSPLQSVMQGEISSVTRRYSDIILAAGVMMVIGMMIIPLPTFLLDLLLVVNITVQVSMLLHRDLHIGCAEARGISDNHPDHHALSPRPQRFEYTTDSAPSRSW